jgi:chlorite dismutase
MSESVELLHGWYTLHDFRHFDAEVYRQSSEEERGRFLNAVMGFWERNEKIDAAKEGSFGVYSIIGHKADLLFLTLRPELSTLLKEEREIAAWPLSQTLVPNYSYFGVVELSNYVVSADQRAQHEEMIQRRLRPSLPHKKSLCFYPMNKKREGQDNWYALPMEERQRMMRSHGKTGRKHADIVTQMISGSIGLDDYEWGVTLFSDDPLAFKTVVTEMRFDEVSARYAEFGAFLVGNRLKKEELLEWFQSHSKA